MADRGEALRRLYERIDTDRPADPAALYALTQAPRPTASRTRTPKELIATRDW
ncbi:hypothetical protein RKD27_001260 [Streptomyces sp. SAI-126]|uniref:hypothetical protein n=1 Tax=unclassified Streptomyces TaxID=2593676 RepID=UPI000FB52ED5|nr:hypothetical protein [Streptomyces sp. A2-16]QUC58138.1 hypothetical protein IOD14_15745 [Streptomyces sp. A2-16]